MIVWSILLGSEFIWSVWNIGMLINSAINDDKVKMIVYLVLTLISVTISIINLKNFVDERFRMTVIDIIKEHVKQVVDKEYEKKSKYSTENISDEEIRDFLNAVADAYHVPRNMLTRYYNEKPRKERCINKYRILDNNQDNIEQSVPCFERHDCYNCPRFTEE